MKYKLLVLSAVIASQVQVNQAHAEDNQIQGAPFLTVGNDNACDFNTIQGAVDSTLSNVIRIASNKLYVESVGVIDRNLTLQGGYADCSDADANITDQSQAIVGGVGNHAIQVSSNNQRRDVALRNLAFGGASVGITTGGDLDLIVEDVLVSNNDMGVFIFNGDQNINFNDVSVSGNNGVGIVCSGSDNVMSINGNSLISDNTASNDGGGMIVNTGCRANVYAPTQITGNTANGHGGGVAVINGAIANLNGVDISSNAADLDGGDNGHGGGVYVNGTGSIVNAVNVKFEGNSASRGGAVAVAENGSFTSYAANSVQNPCMNLGECTSFQGNSVSVLGGVFYAASEGKILAMHALISHNGAPNSGLVALANGGAHIEIEGSVIVKNGGEDLPATDLFNVAGFLDNTTRITLDHVTVADNELTDSVIRNSNGHLSLKSSIVQEEAAVSSATNPESLAFECLIVHETDSFSAGGTVTIDDPLFIGSGNYHIKPSSPAIDYCYAAASLTVELGYDIDLDGRNYDDPNVDDLHGTYDIGADEYRWDNDLIFMNGFEQD